MFGKKRHPNVGARMPPRPYVSDDKASNTDSTTQKANTNAQKPEDRVDPTEDTEYLIATLKALALGL